MADVPNTTRSGAEIKQALAVAQKIESMAEELLAPMAAEMRRPGWRPEFRHIMWETIAHKAKARGRKRATAEQ